jgi:hypothetical protein
MVMPFNCVKLLAEILLGSIRVPAPVIAVFGIGVSDRYLNTSSFNLVDVNDVTQCVHTVPFRSIWQAP